MIHFKTSTFGYSRGFAALATIALGLGCSGEFTSKELADNTKTRVEVPLKKVADLTGYARLTKQEYRYVVTDLLSQGESQAGLAPVLTQVEEFSEKTYTGYYKNHSDIIAYPGLEADMVAFAKLVSTHFLKSDLFKSLCPTAGQCVNKVTEDLLPRLWRKTLLKEEVQALISFYGSFPADKRDYYLLLRVFSSPFFHYKIFDEKLSDKVAKSFKVGNLISYAIAGSLPDTRLQADIEAGALTSPAIVRQHVARLLASYPERFSIMFVSQWLGISSLYESAGDYKGVPLRTVMAEPAMIFAELLKDKQKIDRFVDLDFNMLTSGLAELYGKAAGPGWSRVKVLDSIFGTAAMSYLTTDHENGNPNPIRRGSHMVNHLLCKEIKFPSSAIQNQVDEIVNNAPEGLSPPDRMKYFRSHAACASCHVHIDFHGLALEQIGAFGELKTTYYTGDKIEAKGVVDGIRFNSSKEFSEKLAKKAAINSCFASQVYSYLSSMAHTTVHRKLTRPEEQSLLNGMTTDQVIVEMFVRMFVGGE